MNTSYLYITPRNNWDSNHRMAVDQNLVTKKTFPWNTPVHAIKPGETTNVSTVFVQNFDKDIYDLMIDSVDYKVINIISKPEPTGAKALSEDVVKAVAEQLMDANGTTTNLDIKEELRNQGYWVKQKTVSDYMQSLCASNPQWDVANNGTYNTYAYVGASQASMSTPPAQNTTTAHAAPTKVRKPRVAGKIVPMIFFQNLSSLNDVSSEGKSLIKDAVKAKQLNTTNFMDTQQIWVVYCPTTKDVGLFEPDFSSDDVRNAFRKVIKVPVQATRARRLSNIDHWKIN